jgi:peptide/nickel transport system permease protein
MAAKQPAAQAPARRAPAHRRREWLFVLTGAAKTPRGRVGLILIVFVVLVAVIGPAFAPYSPTAFVTGSFNTPSRQTLLGGDELGRDVLSRVLAGGWQLLVLALAATLLGLVVGTIAGMSAAYRRGFSDGLIMRCVDVLLAFPQLIFALMLVSILGSKLWLLVVAIGLAHAPQVARVVRSTTLDVSEREYVHAAEIIGVSPWRVMVKDILPNLTTPLMVEAGIRLTYSISILAGLSFLGFGLQPPSPNWGTMINENRIGLTENPWGVVAPAILIAMLTIGLNTFTDAVARVSLGVDRVEESVVYNLLPTDALE